MSEILSPIESLPDISFIDNLTLEDVLTEMITDYQTKYYEITGKNITLAQADPNRLILYSCALQIYQGLQYVDRAGKQNLLKYSYSEFLDNVGASKGVTRNPAKPATVMMRFTLSEIRTSATPIPVGTRVSAGNIYFESTEYHEIPAGIQSIDIEMTCTTEGEAGNDILVGEITTLVDPIGYVASVVNISKSSGGSEIESDKSYAERIFLAPSGYSVAGPEDAYTYWVKTYNQRIKDVVVTSPRPVEVDIRLILENGELPDSAFIAGVQEYIMNNKKRPLTDLVTIGAPDVAEYNIELTYYINKSDASKATTIQTQVNEAIRSYVEWQSSKIGRDINPDELRKRIITAGAKRIELISPEYIDIPETSIARLNTSSIRYGGIEND